MNIPSRSSKPSFARIRVSKGVLLTTEPRLAAGGDAVARAPDGRVVFVPGAAPSEKIRIDVVKDNARFLRGRLREVIAPSPFRVEPECRHVDSCGGCTLQHVSARAQLDSKQAALVTTLRKLGRVEPARVLPPWSGSSYGYRARVRLAATPDGRLGYRESRGHSVTPVEACPVLHPALQALLPELRGPEGGGRKRRASPPELHMVTDGVRVAAKWRGLAEASGPQPSLPTLTWIGADASAEDGALRPDLFSQSNLPGNDALRDQLTAWLDRLRPQSALELYAGSGNFTAVLAAHAARVVTYESAPLAVARARRAMPSRVRIKEATAEAAVDELQETYDVALVDPPRAGLSPAVGEGLTVRARRALMYVSCDAATFARDAGRWAQAGWRLEEVRLFDLYPQTAHVEVAGLFTPAGSPDTSVSLAGSPDTSVSLAGSPDTSVSLAGSPDTSVSLAGSPDTSVSLAGSPDTSGERTD